MPPRRRRTATIASRGVALVAAVALSLVVAACGSSSSTPSASTPSDAATDTTTDTTTASATALPEDLQAELEETLAATMNEYQVPGATVGVWVPGVGSWEHVAGIADRATDTATSTEMSWPLRSITKSFTVTLVLQLVDDGKIALDDPISTYVDGVTDGDKVTVRQLADMTSGVADYTNDKFVEAYQADPDRVFSLADLNGFMLGDPAQFAPGTQHVYTNANTNLLGAMIENVTDQPFADVLDERILQPLGLSQTRYLAGGGPWDEAHASGYMPDDPDAVAQNFSVFGPAGAMVTDLHDARVWGEALATGELLDPGTQAARLEGAPLDEGPPYGRYALGIGETDGWWGHNGEGFGFTSAVFHDTDSGATVAVFMNLSNVASGAHPADQLFRRYGKILAGS